MHFNSVTLIGVMLTVITPFHIFAQTLPIFSVSPKVCAVQNSQQECELDIELMWQLTEKKDVCITYQDKPIKCWQQAQTGKFSYKAHVQFQSVYSLVNRQTGDEIASARIQVQSENIKAQRRRLRSPWSFF